MKPVHLSIFRRESSLRALREWLKTCIQPLLIIGPPYCGKTYFVKQLQTEFDCVAVHYCRAECPETSEAATIIRSIAAQLIKRFPNLVLPDLSTVTLLVDFSSALEHYLTLPLASLPRPTKAMFIVIDDVQPHIYEMVLALLPCLPPWLRLVITSRPLFPSDQYKFNQFHDLILSQSVDELIRFVEVRLPQCSSNEVLDSCEGSWFFVDQLSRAIDYGIIAPDRIPCRTKDLLDDMCTMLPIRLPIYLLLIKSSRHAPSQDHLLAVAQLVISDDLDIIQKEIDEILLIMESRDPLILSGSWVDMEGDLAPYHTAWAEFFKTKRRKTPQDVIELAYHLAHSTVFPMDSIRTLASLGADNLILKCSVIDLPTSILLNKAGTVIQEYGMHDDFVYLCSTGTYDCVESYINDRSDLDLSSGLLAAASRGHVAICERILKKRPTVAHFILDGHWNALRTAACNNHLDVLNLLLECGTNVNDCGIDGRTALRAAAWAGHLDIVRRLLESGADVDKKDSEERTALMAAAFMNHYQVVELLLDHGANIQQTDSAGATALHLTLSNGACSEAHGKTVDILIDRGSDINLPDAHGRLCIHLAAYHGDKNLQRLMSAMVCIDVQDSLGRTPLMLAASQGQLHSVELLMSNGAYIDSIDAHGRTAFQLAAIHGHLSVVDLLLTLGADEAHKDNDGAVALHYAVVHGDVELTRALAMENTVNAADRLGNHPLIIACQHNNVEVVCELLNMGAPSTRLSLNGQSALRVAALAGNTKIVQVLAERTIDWEQLDMDGTPLVHSLLINKQTAMAELLLTLGALTSSRDIHGRTCAHVVSSTNDLCGARMLRRFGCSFESTDNGGRTPLMTAVWAGNTCLSSYLLDTVGVSPNAVDKQGASALSIAAQLGHRDMVILLLRFGAEPSLPDLEGRTALDVAKISGHEHIKMILQTACGSADSSGFGSVPNSPMDTKSLGRKSFRKCQKLTLTSPRLIRKVL